MQKRQLPDILTLDEEKALLYQFNGAIRPATAIDA